METVERQIEVLKEIIQEELSVEIILTAFKILKDNPEMEIISCIDMSKNEWLK